MGNPENPCIVFFHGFMGSGRDWEIIIEKLSDNFYCLAVDLPGHGKTTVHGLTTDYKMETFAGYFTKFIKSLNLNMIVLVGYSMGGRFALFLSVHVKNLWNAIVLESATPGLQKDKQRLERQTKDNKIARKLEQGDFSTFLKDWYQQPLFKSLQKTKNFDSIFKRRLDNNPEELAKSLRMMGVGIQPSLWNACKNINIPVLLLAGEFDRKFCNIIKDMKKINNEFEIKIINHAGHNVHIEKPEYYYQHLDKFLTSIREKRS
jgi:2-succinyl-6-hydroxy-2,4-cyclohexadiene-1-carboxylate synthase